MLTKPVSWCFESKILFGAVKEKMDEKELENTGYVKFL